MPKRIILFICISLIGCTSSPPDRVRIAAAASLKPIVNDLALPATITYGATGSLIAQVTHGADFDLVLTADEASARQLTAHRPTAETFPFAIGRLALLVRTAEPFDSLAVLQSPSVRTIAVPNPRVAPYGFAAQTVLRKHDLESSLSAKFVFPENAEQAANLLTTGAVDAAFVSAAVRVPNTQRWLIPQEWHDPLTHIGVFLKPSPQTLAIRRTLESDAVREQFARLGYALPPK
jgi:molybdate transport system substrate-binding protein